MIDEHTGALLIDMQDVFLDKIADIEGLVGRQKSVLGFLASKNLPVAVIEMRDAGDTIKVLRDKVSMVPRHEYFGKIDENGFGHAYLGIWLRTRAVRKVLLMGVNASECVRATGKGALEYGFDIFTSGDLIADASSARLISPIENWYKDNGIFVRNYKSLLGAPNLRIAS